MRARALSVLAIAGAGFSVLTSTAFAQQRVTGNEFNPAVSLILDGRYAEFENDPEAYELPGFQLGGEAGLGEEGFSLGHSELTLTANIDDRFFGWFTAAIDDHEGETEVELEEAWFETLGLGHGLTIKGGRFFSEIGYLNRLHEHATDFADDPLVYRALFGGRFNDTGVQLEWVAPTDLFINLGVELTRGGDFPANAEGGGIGAALGFIDIGGDFGIAHSWKLGLSYLDTESEDREGGGHGHGKEEEHGHGAAFTGDSEIAGIDLVYKWAPLGNPTERNFQFQAEYFVRDEDGGIVIEEEAVTETSTYDGEQSGWYAQAVYQFIPKWRVGLRYDELDSDNDGSDPTILAEAGLDDEDHTPRRSSVMLDYSHSEFSRLRLQFNHDESYPEEDDQILVQYIMSLGAHGAHQF